MLIKLFVSWLLISQGRRTTGTVTETNLTYVNYSSVYMCVCVCVCVCAMCVLCVHTAAHAALLIVGYIAPRIQMDTTSFGTEFS